jgi:2'-5' RNA ligase
MLNETPRLFIAVSIDDHWREKLTKQCSILQSKLPFQKWTDPADYHVTLKFLGDTSFDLMKSIYKLLTDAAQATTPFQLTDNGWGTFGPQTAPNILWAGIGGGVHSLNQLQQKVDERMGEMGFTRETRSFHPHLTLARRFKGKSPLTAPIKQYLPVASEPPIHWLVSEIKLYQSHLQKKPMYEAIAAFKLGNEKD